MKAKQRMEITLETRETTVIRLRQSRTTAFCETCQAEVSHLTIAEAASVLSLINAETVSLTETGRIHSSKNTAGNLMLCGKSLAALAKE